MQLCTVHLGRMWELFYRWERRVRTAEEALPHGLLREWLRATLLNQTFHDLMLRAHGVKDSPAGFLAVRSLSPVTAVQTCRGQKRVSSDMYMTLPNIHHK